MKLGRRKDKIKPVAKANTLAILDSLRKIEHSKVTIPTEEGVIEAKEWVETNEK